MLQSNLDEQGEGRGKENEESTHKCTTAQTSSRTHAHTRAHARARYHTHTRTLSHAHSLLELSRASVKVNSFARRVVSKIENMFANVRLDVEIDGWMLRVVRTTRNRCR